MIDIVIPLVLVAVAVIGFARRPDETAGSLLAVLTASIPITHGLSERFDVVLAMLLLEALLAVCMVACWCRWVSQRARAVLLFSIGKMVLMLGLGFGPMTVAQWQPTMAMIHALLVGQLLVAGGMGDVVIRLLDRADPASARDRDLHSDRVGT
jgi:hypothetical protein